MHKIKKGIKKKIKGKKGKHGDDEIFTEEELEQYKREKAEEARRQAEEQQQHADHPLDETFEAEPVNDYHEPQKGYVEEDNSSPPEAKAGNSDWKSFLATTDTVLKTTSDNLEHIKESSYFQSKKGNEREEGLPAVELVETVSQRQSACSSPVTAAPSKGWVDLEQGGIYDESGNNQVTETARPVELEPQPKKKFVELKPIEDLPDVSAEDYADCFDTAYVDDIESGDLKLIIPDSPIEDYSNEPDPFDTSAADRVLHIEEPKPEPVPQPKVISGTKAKQAEVPKKRKIQLVSLGNAVDVLTGKAPTIAKEVDESKQVNLLGDFDENYSEEGDKKRKDSSGSLTEQDSGKKVNDEDSNKETEEVTPEATKEKTGEEAETNAIDDILFGVDEPLDNLPELGVPVINKKETSEEEEKNTNPGLEFDDLLNTDQEDVNESKEKNRKHVDLKDLVSEFDVIDNFDTVEDTLIPKLVDDPILDEFDAEFASLAHESVAKQKDKEIDEIGLEDDDDPFDTSHISQVLGDKNEKDPFDVEFSAGVTEHTTATRKTPSRPPLPSAKPPKSDLLGYDPYEEVDPFDTSVADKILPVDHLKTTANDADLAGTLEPSASDRHLTKSESFDPFDTSAADAFGITELKVLENELLPDGIGISQLKSSDSDFDFNPRAEEDVAEEIEVAENQSPVAEASCLLSSEVGSNEGIILTPQGKLEVEEPDPFDTSIADKIQIKSLEDDFLEKPTVNTDSQLTSVKTLQPKSKPPPRPASPACLLASSPVTDDVNPALQPSQNSNTITDPSVPIDDDEIDPFDTSIAEAYGKTELKVLESEFLTDTKVATPIITPKVKEIVEPKAVQKDTLALEIKPPRPPSPACLLAATPLDENPTLVPQAQPIQLDQDEDFDPFDTSIAQQFGKTELHVLESELLSASPSQIAVVDEFDPRAVSPLTVSNKPPKPQRPASPLKAACLLTATPDTESPADLPIAPSEIKQNEVADDFDPFDTSIADKFGTTELKNLEDELLSRPSEVLKLPGSANLSVSSESGNSLKLSTKPGRPPVPSEQCLLATTPTDCSQPLQPFTKTAEANIGAEAENFDPFDTSIANQFGKTEIKELEQSLLTTENNLVKPKYTIPKVFAAAVAPNTDIDPFDTSIADQVTATSPEGSEGAKLKRTLSDDEFNPRHEDSKRSAPLDLLDSTEDTYAPIPILQPKEVVDTSEPEEIDPFDTSIAASIVPGKTELKLLESELLHN